MRCVNRKKLSNSYRFLLQDEKSDRLAHTTVNSFEFSVFEVRPDSFLADLMAGFGYRYLAEFKK